MRRKINNDYSNNRKRFQNKINKLNFPNNTYSKISVENAWRVRKIFLTFISCFVFILLCGIDDREAIELYLNKLQELSEHKIKDEQKLLAAEFYCFNEDRDPSQKKRHKIRSEFNAKKRRLKAEWESIYKLSWPKTTAFSTSKSTTAPILKKSVKSKKSNNLAIVNQKQNNNIIIHSYEAHHIIPINAGGINQWWNLSPLSGRNHQLLHDSIEEKACFSHDFVHQKTMRFILRVKEIFWHYFGDYIYKKGTNYAHSFKLGMTAYNL